MSDDFIPLNQSTPVRNRWQNGNQQQGGYQNNWQHKNHQRRGHNRKHWSNNSQHSNSFGVAHACSTELDDAADEHDSSPPLVELAWVSSKSDSNTSYDRENKPSIEAYLHPSMLEDPWEKLRLKMQSKQKQEQL